MVDFIANSLLNPTVKKILKIDQHFAKLLTKNVGLFYDSQCICVLNPV